MKVLVILLLYSPAQSRSDRSWGVALITTSLHERRLHHPATTQSFIPTHQLPSRWLASPTSLLSLNDPTDANANNEKQKNTEEEPSMLRCASSNDSHHIYQMNIAALQKLLVTQQHRLLRNQTTKDDVRDTSGICNTNNETSSSFIDSIINFTTAHENASSDCLLTTNNIYDPEVYFVAIDKDYTIDDPAESQESNDIHINSILSSINPSKMIGITAIQLRRKSPLIAGSSTTTNNEKDLPAVSLPTPHFYVLNLHVHDQFRQCGVGTSLLASIVEYCRCYNMQHKGADLQLPYNFDSDERNESNKSDDDVESCHRSDSTGGRSSREEELLYKLQLRQQQRKVSRRSNISPEANESFTTDEERIPIVLSVDSDNIPALRLYEKFGFEYLEQNNVFCMMVMRP